MKDKFLNPNGARFRITKTEGGRYAAAFWLEEWKNYTPDNVKSTPPPKWQWRVLGKSYHTYDDVLEGLKRVIEKSRPETEYVVGYFDNSGDYVPPGHPGDE